MKDHPPLDKEDILYNPGYVGIARRWEPRPYPIFGRNEKIDLEFRQKGGNLSCFQALLGKKSSMVTPLFTFFQILFY